MRAFKASGADGVLITARRTRIEVAGFGVGYFIGVSAAGAASAHADKGNNARGDASADD